VSQRQPVSVVSIMLCITTIILCVSRAKRWENWLKCYKLINHKIHVWKLYASKQNLESIRYLHVELKQSNLITNTITTVLESILMFNLHLRPKMQSNMICSMFFVVVILILFTLSS